MPATLIKEHDEETDLFFFDLNAEKQGSNECLYPGLPQNASWPITYRA